MNPPLKLAPRASLILLLASSARAAELHVGPNQPYVSPCRAIAAAAAGDTIQIEAAGAYRGDVCAWTTHDLTIIGINGRPRIDAAGKNAQGKAIWVVSGNNTTIENIEFTGAAVPDHNGAAIRLEGANLTMRNCYLHGNQEGILAGDSPTSQILIESTEFAENGYSDGYSHNIYINHVAKFTLRYSYSARRHLRALGEVTRAAELHPLQSAHGRVGHVQPRIGST